MSSVSSRTPVPNQNGVCSHGFGEDSKTTFSNPRKTTMLLLLMVLSNPAHLMLQEQPAQSQKEARPKAKHEVRASPHSHQDQTSHLPLLPQTAWQLNQSPRRNHSSDPKVLIHALLKKRPAHHASSSFSMVRARQVPTVPSLTQRHLQVHQRNTVESPADRRPKERHRPRHQGG